jgi:hypothetical protein
MMDENKLRKYKWFWAWQDEAEEAWLREMSQQGWHLYSVGIPTVYDFEVGDPADIVYRLDYQSPSKVEKEDYLQLFKDAGWEHVGEMSGWQYFRKPAQPGEEMEIYTDAESKTSKYQRLLIFAGILMLPLFMGMINTRGGFLFFVIFPLFLLYIYIFIRIMIRINQLKRI